MKKLLSIILVMVFAFSGTAALAEAAQPTTTENTMPGEPPAMPDGQAPGAPPDGIPPQGGPGGGGPGGPGNSQPESYVSVNTYSGDSALDGGDYASNGIDENAILVTDGAVVTIDGATITRTSTDSTGGDTSSFYGVGAALLVTDGTVRVTGSSIVTDSAGGAGVFSYGDGVAYVEDTTINTQQNTSGGIHVAGGGTLYAKNLTVETNGESAAAIRSDRGSGILVVDGGTYISSGVGSPAVYCTADISINNATLTATGSEALCLEGLNTVRLFDSALSGDMRDLDQNDNTWTVILYQSFSGDSEVGEGKFEMIGGTIDSSNGGLFYTTNTQSEFILSGVSITAAEDSGYFLRCTGNGNARGWGTAGANGADCKFTAIAQAMNGDVIWDDISMLDFYAANGSTLTGAVVNDQTFAGDGGNGYCNLYIDSESSWVVTGDSALTTLGCEGAITDAEGNSVSIVGVDGTTYVQGDSRYVVTVSEYFAICDLSGMGTASQWSDYAVAM